MAFLIRKARPEDAAALADIRWTGWRETYPHLLSAEFLASMEPTPAMLERWEHTAASAERLAVAEVDGAPRGFAWAGDSDEPDAPHPLQLFVLYQYATEHGSGTGQALLDAVLGNEPAYLWTAEDNPRAISFYRRNGFEPDGARTVDDRWENLAEIRMVRGS